MLVAATAARPYRRRSHALRPGRLNVCVHLMLPVAQLRDLLGALEFDKTKDTVVLLGDLVCCLVSFFHTLVVLGCGHRELSFLDP